MRPVLTAAEMRWCDETTISKYGVPGLLLMENAGRGIVEVIKKEYSTLESKNILVVCGKGNNGGDGFVVARLLSNICAQVDVLLIAPASELKGDAKENFKILQKFAKNSSGRLIIQKYSNNIFTKLKGYDLIIDAIFGTGFSGSVKKPYTNVIEWINNQNVPIISVDIPSGINGTTGQIANCAVQTNVTATLGKLKTGLLCNQGREYCGVVHIVDIGIPRNVIEDKRMQTFLVEQSDIQKILPKRSLFAHKYNVGKVFVLAGSNGLTGAAALCCTSAMRIGAGAVVLGTPESVYSILAKKLTEVMVFPLPATKEGTLSADAYDQIRDRFSWADVMVVGPGLSKNQETQKFILKVISEYNGKIVIDADGLNAIAAYDLKKLQSLKSEIILTPHVGEFSRLTGLSADEIEQHRIEVARNAAKRFRTKLVLKGVPTATASEDGKVVLNSTGNPGMATAGTGDVLTGIIAGLWAQGMTKEEAAWTGVYLHGFAGDIAAKKFGEKSLVANDIIEYLPTAFQKIEIGEIV